MATGNSQPEADRQGIDFRVYVQIPWNAPEAFMTLDSPGVFVLDAAYVPDILGLRTRYPDAEPVKVLQGRARESVCVLIPDAKVTDCGFHDVTLVDMASADEPVVLMGDLCLLRRQWPTSVVSEVCPGNSWILRSCVTTVNDVFVGQQGVVDIAEITSSMIWRNMCPCFI